MKTVKAIRNTVIALILIAWVTSGFGYYAINLFNVSHWWATGTSIFIIAAISEEITRNKFKYQKIQQNINERIKR